MSLDYFITTLKQIIKRPDFAKSYIEFEMKLILDKKLVNNTLVGSNYSAAEIQDIHRGIFERLCERDLVECQHVNIITENGMNKQFEYKNGAKDESTKKIYSKTRLKDIYQPGVWRLKACTETPADEHKCAFKVIRFKRRFSCALDVEWRIDFTFVKQIEYNAQKQAIREANHQLFNTNTCALFDIAQIEIEVEYTGDIAEISVGKVQHAIDQFNQYLPSVRANSDIYQNHVSVLKKITGKMENNKHASIKQILPQVSDISKSEYYDLITRHNHYMTNKIDGERVILFLDGLDDGYLTTSGWVPVTAKSYCKVIIDCELLNDTFYIFDVLWFKLNLSPDKPQINAYMCPFELRLEVMRALDLSKIQIKDHTLVIKTFVKFDNNYCESIKHLLKSNDLTPNDGLIFTSSREPYTTTVSYKWKPIECLSIDFVLKKCPQQLLGIIPYIKKRKQTLYLLFVGIRPDMCRLFGIKKVQYYGMLFRGLKRGDYFPIQFAPSSDPDAYLFWHDDGSLDNKIAELTRVDGTWRLLRLRGDRLDDYANEQYFGNDFRVAECIWNRFENPFTVDHLTMPVDKFKSEFYFIENDPQSHRSIRKFNNYVKQQIIRNCCVDSPSALDIGSGKGQDLLKYIKSGVGKLMMTDINKNNTDEIINRKHLYYKQGHFTLPVSIGVKACDFMVDGLSLRVFSTKYGLIVCNFAIHYLVMNATTAIKFVDIIDGLLDINGRVAITYLNGKKVFNKVIKNGSWNRGKYSINQKFISRNYTGSNQKIDIRLPFSDGFYEEYLFNVNYLIDHFKPKKIIKDSCGEFSDYVNAYEANHKQFQLDADDKEYIELLEYIIFKKQ